jgi:HlyD family secretion protein
MKRLRRLSVFFLVVLAAAGIVWFLQRPRPVAVLVHRVERGRVEATVSNTRAGTVKACRRAKLAPPAGGLLAGLFVREGQRVRKGEVLLQLWNEDLKANVELAEREAGAASARAEEACLVAELAVRELARQKTLQAQGLAQDDVVDRADTDSRAKAAACVAAREAAKVAGAQVSVARAALEKTVIEAPFDGIVARVDAELGEYVTPSPPGIPMPPAVDLIEENCLYVRTPLDEVDAPRVRPGMPARITVDAFSRQSFEGRVRRVAPYVEDVEKQARTVDVDVDIVSTPQDTVLLPGYSADVEVVLEVHDDALRLPTEAILEGGRVLVLSQKKLEERTITRGISGWQFTEVLSGLEAGDLVVTSLDREGVKAGAAAVLDGERGTAVASSR